MPVPLVPLKALADAKGRLAPFLTPVERRLLALAMFEDVAAALQAVAGLDRPLVVSPDREVWRRAEAIGCRVVAEAGPGGLNAALLAAARAAGATPSHSRKRQAPIPRATRAGIAELETAWIKAPRRPPRPA